MHFFFQKILYKFLGIILGFLLSYFFLSILAPVPIHWNVSTEHLMGTWNQNNPCVANLQFSQAMCLGEIPGSVILW